jgi:hypothetical protein
MKKTKHITITLDDFTFNELQKEAERQRRSLGQLTALLIQEVIRNDFLNRQTVQPLIKAHFIKVN